MEQTRQMGRMLRAKRVTGYDIIVNLDHVTKINPCKHPTRESLVGDCTRVWYDSSSFDDIDQPFESFCVAVMTSEFQFLTGYVPKGEPTPPLSRRELDALQNLAVIRNRDLEPNEDCDPIFVGTEG